MLSAFTLRTKIILTMLFAELAVVLFFVFRTDKPDMVPVEELVVQGPVQEIIGQSVEGRNIEVYRYEASGEPQTHLLFIGGIHGGYEWNSVLLAWRFIDYLEENPDIIPSHITVTIIPVLNPDGLYSVVGTSGRFAVQDVSSVQSVRVGGQI